MGVDGWSWGFMGAMGCMGTSAQQNKGERSQNGQTVHVLNPWWPGKFPRTWCFLAFSENAHKRINMDDYGFRWVQWDAGARAQGKTTEKEPQMVVSRLFCDVCQGKKKTGTWQGWLRWPYRILSGMSAKKGVRINCLCLLQKVRRENLGNNAKKTQKPANSNWCKPNKISQKKQAYKMSPKRKKKKQQYHKTNYAVQHADRLKSGAQKEPNVSCD